MRTEIQINQEIERIESVIKNVTDAKELATMPGGERFVAFLEKSQATYEKLLGELDPYSDKIGMDFLKYKFIVSELKKIIAMFANAEKAIEFYQKEKLRLNEELSKAKKEAERREKNLM